MVAAMKLRSMQMLSYCNVACRAGARQNSQCPLPCLALYPVLLCRECRRDRAAYEARVREEARKYPADAAE